MSARIPADPKYRHYKPKDLAVVRINGKDHYLGAHGSDASWERYYKLLAEWRTTGRVEPPKPKAADGPPATLTVAELILGYWRHVERYYRTPDGKPSQEQANLKDALQPVNRLYGSAPAATFGPLALRAVRESMIRSGLSRRVINARVHRIRRCFRWGASVQMIPGSVVVDLETVDALEAGRTDAPELPPVEPVAIEHVEATLPRLTRPVAAMVRLQLLCGCRAGEIMAMRGCDLVPGEPTWEYRPASHKTAWRGKKRVIPLGPKAVEIVRVFLKPDTTAYLFSPADAVAEMREERRGTRKSKPTPSERKRRSRRKPTDTPADRYDRRTYRQAVVRACDMAFPHPVEAELRAAARRKGQSRAEHRERRAELTAWREVHRDELKAWRVDHRWSPLQLRHTAATAIRARYGLEATSNVLGHAKPDTSLIYAERDLARARSIAAEIG